MKPRKKKRDEALHREFAGRLGKAVPGGLSEAARALGIPKTSVQTLKEASLPSFEMLRKICEALNVSADYFLGLVDEEMPIRGKNVERWQNHPSTNKAILSTVHKAPAAFARTSPGSNIDVGPSIEMGEAEVFGDHERRLSNLENSLATIQVTLSSISKQLEKITLGLDKL